MTRSFLVSLHVEDGSVPAAVTGRSQISVFGEMLPPEGPWKRAALSGKMPPETRRGEGFGSLPWMLHTRLHLNFLLETAVKGVLCGSFESPNRLTQRVFFIGEMGFLFALYPSLVHAILEYHGL